MRWIRAVPILLAAAAVPASPARAGRHGAGARRPVGRGGDAAAAQLPDPVAGKLVTYFRLLAPGAAGVGARSRSSWRPARTGRCRRRWRAGATRRLPPSRTMRWRWRNATSAAPPVATAALLRCAEAYQAAGRAPMPPPQRCGAPGSTVPAIAAAEARSCSDCTPPLTRRRPVAAVRSPRLDRRRRRRRGRSPGWIRPTSRAPRRGWRSGATIRTRRRPARRRCPPAQRSDPGPGARAGALAAARRPEDAALALWASAGTARPERAAPPERQAAFWQERNILARRRLSRGRRRGRLRGGGRPGADAAEQVVDAEFLAGFIALRRLDDPGGATPAFRGAGRRLEGGDHAGPRALLAGPRRGRAGRRRRREGRVRGGGRLAHHLLRPARRAGAGRRSGGARRAHPRRARSRPPMRTRALDLAGRELARAAALSGELGRAAPRPAVPAAARRRHAGPRRPRAGGAARASGSACRTWRSPSPAAPGRDGVMLPDDRLADGRERAGRASSRR